MKKAMLLLLALTFLACTKPEIEEIEPAGTETTYNCNTVQNLFENTVWESPGDILLFNSDGIMYRNGELYCEHWKYMTNDCTTFFFHQWVDPDAMCDERYPSGHVTRPTDIKEITATKLVLHFRNPAFPNDPNRGVQFTYTAKPN